MVFVSVDCSGLLLIRMLKVVICLLVGGIFRFVDVFFCGLRLMIIICCLMVVRVVFRLMVVVVLLMLFFWLVMEIIFGVLLCV